ncbi:MAG: hypothetical protein ACKPKO_01870, partial [Candidatus Fonsibacter sp.]
PAVAGSVEACDLAAVSSLAGSPEARAIVAGSAVAGGGQAGTAQGLGGGSYTLRVRRSYIGEESAPPTPSPPRGQKRTIQSVVAIEGPNKEYLSAVQGDINVIMNTKSLQ